MDCAGKAPAATALSPAPDVAKLSNTTLRAQGRGQALVWFVFLWCTETINRGQKVSLTLATAHRANQKRVENGSAPHKRIF